eukprot:5929825-Amphidinium_carterae.1
MEVILEGTSTQQQLSALGRTDLQCDARSGRACREIAMCSKHTRVAKMVDSTGNTSCFSALGKR